MLPYIYIFSHSIPTLLLSVSLYFFLVCYLLRRWTKTFKLISVKEVFVYTSLHFTLGLLGARVFYVLFTYDLLSALSTKIFYLNQGRVSYGALLGLCLAQFLYIYSRPKEYKKEYWNIFAKLLVIGVIVLRVQCFFDGCCWGKTSSNILSIVNMNPGSMTPLLGVPLHPVQLYESALGFLILLILFKVEKYKISLMPITLLLYSMGRFIIEFYRGDKIRGIDIILGLSTGQVLSVALFVSILICYPPKKIRLDRLLSTQFGS